MTIHDYEIVVLGIHHCDYFQGFGNSFTKYAHSTTGFGNNFAEAFEDALENIAMTEGTAALGALDDEELIAQIKREHADTPTAPGYSEDKHYFVGVRYNLRQ